MTTASDPSAVAQRIAELKLEHRALDAAIHALQQDAEAEDLHIRRLKKRKLQLKDAIAMLESQLIPDLDA
ncbi:MAG: YdcH family protein [Xanthomonadales bacterium]|nr:YdcH family protein [Xanthomonadales bacterium]